MINLIIVILLMQMQMRIEGGNGTGAASSRKKFLFCAAKVGTTLLSLATRGRMNIKLDDKDRAILRVLQARSNSSIAEISSAVGLSPTPTWKRVNRLHTLGVIAEQVSLLDPVKVGLPITVFAQVSIRPAEQDIFEKFDAAIQKIDYIVECYTVTGERDFILKLVIETVDNYERLLKTTLIHLPGVFAIESIISLSRGKYTTKLPL